MFWDMVGKPSHSSMINCHSSFGANWLALPSLAHADITNQLQLPFLLSLYSTPESLTHQFFPPILPSPDITGVCRKTDQATKKTPRGDRWLPGGTVGL